ncbi:MAG: rRNA maturation RNase YbeY [Desulfovibrionaceae bacterium]|nr:rRNA maturation RNase YbeY [Desulfovibrionaceae bacterium]
MNIRIEEPCLSVFLPFDARQLRKICCVMMETLNFASETELDLRLTGDAGIAELNLAYLACFGPTNILSFPNDDGSYLGSLALNVEMVSRESLLYGQDPSLHCLRLLAHGIGHLAGYDHGSEMDEVCAACLEHAVAFVQRERG